MTSPVVSDVKRGLAVALLMSVGIATDVRAADKPNIVFIMGDDIGSLTKTGAAASGDANSAKGEQGCL